MSELNKYSAIIIGGGCLGASVFRSLKLKGMSNILVLDKAEVASGISSKSGGMSRVFHKNLEHRVAAKFSQNVFYHLKNEIGLNVDQVGSLSIIKKEHLAGVNLNDFEILGADQLKQRFPQMNYKSDELGIFERRGASINVKEYIQKVLSAYKGGNDTVLENTLVKNVFSLGQGNYEVATTRGSFSTSNVIVTSGLGIRSLLPGFYVDQKLSKREIITYKVDSKVDISFPNVFDYTSIFYSTNSFGGHRGKLVAGMQSSLANSFESIKEYVDKRMAVEFEISVQATTSQDIYTENRDGFRGSIASNNGIYVLTGWGGGAFKFSPYLGFQLAEEIYKNEQTNLGESYAVGF